MTGPIANSLVNMKKNAAAGTANSLIHRRATDTAWSETRPIQTNFNKPTNILMYPDDIGVNAHQASYILFSIHVVTSAKVKTITDKQVRQSGKEAEETAKYFGDTQAEINKAKSDAVTAARRAADDTNYGKDRSNSLRLARNNIKKLATTIGLYMPPAVNVSYSMDYEAGEIGMLAESLYGLIKDYQSGASTEQALNNAAGTLGDGLKQKAVKTIDAILPGASDLAAIERGVIITPKTEMMFRGIGRRTFSFTFTFIPKDRKESNTVNNIINTFKLHMHPDFVAGSTREMTIPDMFEIAYMHLNKENKYLNRIGKCYLKQMDVTYGGDKFVTYNDDGDGPPPQRTTMAMTFQEIEIIDRKAVVAGF